MGLHLVAPFILIHRGKYVGLVYTILLLTLAYIGCDLLSAAALNFIIDLVRTNRLPKGPAPTVANILFFASWGLMVPVVFVAITQPLRVQFLNYEKLDVRQLIIETPVAFLHCLRSLIFLLRAEFYIFLPAALLGAIYYYALNHQKLSVISNFYLIACVVIALVALHKTMSIVLTPVITVAGRYDSRFALDITRTVVGHQTKLIALLFTFCAAAGLGGWYILMYSGMSIAHLHSARLIWLSFISWYALNLASILCIREIYRYEVQRAGGAMPPQPPTPPGPPSNPVQYQVTNVKIE